MRVYMDFVTSIKPRFRCSLRLREVAVGTDRLLGSAKYRARLAQEAKTTEQKLDEIAKALAAIVKVLEGIQDDVRRLRR